MRDILFAVLFCVWPSAAAASVVTVNFNTASGFIVTSNYTEGGFRFSPNCHYDIVPFGYLGSAAMGWDVSGCDRDFNSNFLGPAQYQQPNQSDAVLYVDEDGHPFTVLSLWEAQTGSFVESFKGGFMDLNAGFTDFSGPDWTGIKWLIFFRGGPGAPSNPIDELTFRTPEPATLALLGLGLAGLGFSRRKQ